MSFFKKIPTSVLQAKSNFERAVDDAFSQKSHDAIANGGITNAQYAMAKLLDVVSQEYSGSNTLDVRLLSPNLNAQEYNHPMLIESLDRCLKLCRSFNVLVVGSINNPDKNEFAKRIDFDHKATLETDVGDDLNLEKPLRSMLVVGERALRFQADLLNGHVCFNNPEKAKNLINYFDGRSKKNRPLALSK